MTTNELKKAIKNLVETKYMNKTVKFDDDWKFRVKGYKIRERKNAVHVMSLKITGSMKIQRLSSSVSFGITRMKWTQLMPLVCSSPSTPRGKSERRTFPLIGTFKAQISTLP